LKADVMNIKVTSRGVTIPRRLLGEAKEVEVRQEDDRIVLVPVEGTGSPPPADDPIWEFGKNPVDFGVTDAPNGEPEALPEHDPIWDLGKDPIDLGITDASVNHDKYLNEELTKDHAP
jgi:hypothetical protein